MPWDLFCRVIDNFGDIGVCWRLAAGLARRGASVRLWVDDPRALAWMAPDGEPGVQWRPWSDAEHAEPGDTVIEAFGCDPPAPFVQRMALRRPAPVWINLEYLSAEGYVERSHGLRSPQFSGPGAGLDKWFFYPGFHRATGGLLRGSAAPADALAWLASHGIAAREHERRVLLFCYAGSPVEALLQRLGDAPTLLLTTPGPATEALAARASSGLPPGLRLQSLPWWPQAQFDRLLHCMDLNLVRGEDSFVQAQWAGHPFVWQIYAQHDGAHAIKLHAFLDRFEAAIGGPVPHLRELWAAWNGLGPWPGALPPAPAWQQATRRWREALAGQADLVTQLQAFVEQRR